MLNVTEAPVYCPAPGRGHQSCGLLQSPRYCNMRTVVSLFGMPADKTNYYVFWPLKVVFISANSADPDEMQQNVCQSSR